MAPYHPRYLQAAAFAALLVAVGCRDDSQPTEPAHAPRPTASADAAGGRGGRVMEFTTLATAINHFVDIGAPGPSTGDIYVWHDNLFDGTDGSDAGFVEGRCNLIDPSLTVPPGTVAPGVRFGCTIVATLHGGTVAMEGMLVNALGAVNRFAITGGTEAFRGVAGETTVELGPPGGPHKVRAVIIR